MPEQTAVTAAGDASSGVAIMLGLGAGTEAGILSSPGVPEPDAPGLHCTVAYLSEPVASYTDEQKQALITALSSLSPTGVADAFATAQFNPDDPEREPCAVLLVQSDWLATFHDQVQGALASVDLQQAATFPIWIPHVAIAYNADVDVIPAGFVGQEIDFNRLVVGWGDDQIVAAGDGAPTTNPASAVTAATEAPVTAPTITDTPEAPMDTDPAAPDYPDGTQWAGPLVQLDTKTGDGRIYSSAGLTIRDLPLPLSFQREGTHGGEAAGTTTVVGRILTAEVRDGVLFGTGDWLDAMVNYDVAEAATRVEGELGMVSGDTGPTLVSYGAEQADGSVVAIDPMLYDGPEDDVIAVIEEWDFMGATLVADPAFGGTRIAQVAPLMDPLAVVDPIEAPSTDPKVGTVIADGATPVDPVVTADAVTFPDGTTASVGDTVHIIGDSGPADGLLESLDPDAQQVTIAVEDPDDSTNTQTLTVDASQLQTAPDDTDDQGDTGAADSVTAAGDPHRYPAEWFEPVALDGPTALTVTDDGRVYGHLATWGVCHTGFSDQCVTAPESPTGYSYFHLGEIDTTAGPLAVGKLTVGGGHANAKLGWQGTVEHYDNAGATGAVVRAHQDEHGVQVTGAVVHNATPEQISALKRSPLSGDWRRIGGNLELVAALGVNVPGFPVPRAALAASGQQLSLVAAGVVRAEHGEGDPSTTGGVTLPSGVQLTSVDVAILASAFDQAATRRTERLTQGDALRSRLRTERADRLRAKLGAS